MNQNKNNSVNSILQHGRVVANTYCVVFPTSRFSYLILCFICDPDNANGR